MGGNRKNKIFDTLAECPEDISDTLSSKCLNIKGNTYNKLKVLYYVGQKNRRAEWLCQCLNCGRYVVANSHNLRSGHTKSCGCLISEGLRNDITGQLFGTLKVIRYDKSIKEHPHWIVECLNCGKIYSASADALKRAQSCGCLSSSYGERTITTELKEFAANTNRVFKSQKTFPDCVFREKLRFDCCIEQRFGNGVILIEYDGEQHYRPVKFNNIETSKAYKNYITTQVTDWCKDKYCIENHIPLIRVKYLDVRDKANADYSQFYKNCYIVGEAQNSNKIIDVFGIDDSDFVNYKRATFNIFSGISCTFKCGKELCQNSELTQAKIIRCNIDEIIQRYLAQTISHTITFQGLEVLDNIKQLLWFIYYFRKKCNDTIIIWTGYTKEECVDFIHILHIMEWGNIIIKYGRFIPNRPKRYDEVLGVTLASDNQYAERIS